MPKEDYFVQIFRYLDAIIYGLLSLLIVLLPIVVFQEFMFPVSSSKFFFFSYGIAGIVLLGAFVKLSRVALRLKEEGDIPTRSLSLYISPLDALLFVLCVYICIDVFLVNENWTAIRFVEFLLLACLYIVLRGFNRRAYQMVVFFLIISGSIQAIYGMLQLYSLFPSNNNLFKITGGFSNPGPFACYLSVIFPIALHLYIKLKSEREKNQEKDKAERDKIVEGLMLVSWVLMGMLILLSRSRTALLGMVLSTGFVLHHQYNLSRSIHAVLKGRMQRMAFLLSVLLLLGAAFYGIYLLKKDSADGRMVIWKGASKMIVEKPIFGFGYDKFKAYYLPYQAAYFEKNSYVEEENLADDAQRPFNEYIRVTVESGIVGFLLIMGILYTVFNRNFLESGYDKKYIPALKASVVSFIVISFFSYPLEVLPTKCALIIGIAIISSNQRSIISSSRVSNYLLNSMYVIIFISVSIFSLKFTKNFHKAHWIWRAGYIHYTRGEYVSAIEKYQSIHRNPYLRNSGEFLLQYGKANYMAGKFKEAKSILENAQNKFPNTVLYTSLGDTYKALKEYGKSEEAYCMANNIIPHKFYPKYLLAKMYFETNQLPKALKLANELIEKQAKVESKAVAEIKEEMREMIEKSN